MKDENEDLLSTFRRKSNNAFRRRVYIAVVMGLAILLVSLTVWPLRARRFETTARLRVQISPQRAQESALTVGNESTLDAESFQEALRVSVLESVSDDSLASCIRRAVMQGHSGMAPMTIDQLRDSLQIRVSRQMADPGIRDIHVTRVSDGSPWDRRIVNQIVQELSSRLARKANYDSLERQIEQQINQVAQEQRQWTGRLLAIVLETRSACERYDEQLDELALQLKKAATGQSSISTELQRHIEQVQQQVVTSDLQLLRSLREQLIAHFEVDETDSLVQHLERLIGDREAILAQMDLQQAGSLGNAGPEKVRSNPFMMASYSKPKVEGANADLEQSQMTLAQIRLEYAYQRLDQLKLSLENPVVGKIPLVPFSSAIENQAPNFLVSEIQPANLGEPLDAVPSSRWLMGMSLIAGLLGIAFSLHCQPHQLGRSIRNGRQLANQLGLDLMGTLSSERQKAGWVEHGIRSLGGFLFRAAEVCLLLMLCGVIVAMIWDDQIPGLIAERPITGFCRAIWVLFGR